MNVMKDELFDLLPKEQLDRVFGYEKCEFGIDFLGFTEYYKALSEAIPKGIIIIDFGCNQACQAYYFRNHKKYIGIDVATPIEHRVTFDNCIHFNKSIQHWLLRDFKDLMIKQEDCFAICNYVPDWGAQAMIKQTFQNVFNYYP